MYFIKGEIVRGVDGDVKIMEGGDISSILFKNLKNT